MAVGATGFTTVVAGADTGEPGANATTVCWQPDDAQPDAHGVAQPPQELWHDCFRRPRASESEGRTATAIAARKLARTSERIADLHKGPMLGQTGFQNLQT